VAKNKPSVCAFLNLNIIVIFVPFRIPNLFFVETYKRFPPSLQEKLGNIFDDKSAHSLKILHEISTSNTRRLNQLPLINPYSIEANMTSTQFFPLRILRSRHLPILRLLGISLISPSPSCDCLLSNTLLLLYSVISTAFKVTDVFAPVILSTVSAIPGLGGVGSALQKAYDCAKLVKDLGYDIGELKEQLDVLVDMLEGCTKKYFLCGWFVEFPQKKYYKAMVKNPALHFPIFRDKISFSRQHRLLLA
jgi:hypothetical protein